MLMAGGGDEDEEANANAKEGGADGDKEGVSASMLAAAEAYMAKIDTDAQVHGTSGHDAYVEQYGAHEAYGASASAYGAEMFGGYAPD